MYIYVYLCTFYYTLGCFICSVLGWPGQPRMWLWPTLPWGGVCSSTAYMCVVRSLQRDLCAQPWHRMIGNVLYLVFTAQNFMKDQNHLILFYFPLLAVCETKVGGC